MKIYLARMGSTPFGVFGALHFQGRSLFTVEKPWRNNQPMVSCIPLGEYRLLWRPTTTSVPDEFEGHTWYMVGDTVGLEEGEKLRYRCAIHRGNTEKAVKGCIAPGTGLGFIKQRWAVSSSHDAMLELLELLGPQDHELSINNTLMG